MLVKIPEKTTCIPARKRASAQPAYANWKREPKPKENINCRIPGGTEEFTVTEEAVKGEA